VSRSDVVFGFGDLAARMAALAGELQPETPPVAPATVPGRPHAYVHVGQVFTAATPHVVTTVLGSCVSVGLWDSLSGCGGLNHFLLPHHMMNGSATARFARPALEELLRQLRALGVAPTNLRAKLFGGASVVGATPEHRTPLGLQNVVAARELLVEAGIPVVAEDVGGTHGRKLVFHTHDGAAWVRKL
jgi:chemotaxis protein CheD